MINILMDIKRHKGITNEELADSIGIKRMTLYRWINLVSKPSPMALRLIKKYISKNQRLIKKT